MRTNGLVPETRGEMGVGRRRALAAERRALACRTNTQTNAERVTVSIADRLRTRAVCTAKYTAAARHSGLFPSRRVRRRALRILARCKRLSDAMRALKPDQPPPGAAGCYEGGLGLQAEPRTALVPLPPPGEPLPLPLPHPSHPGAGEHHVSKGTALQC